MNEVIPEIFVEELRGCVALEDVTIFATCEKINNGWQELGRGIISKKQKELGWSDAEAPSKGHKFFIESCAAEVNMHPTSMYDRERVGSTIIARGLLQENMSYSVCTALLRNTARNEDRVIPIEEVQRRIDWFNNETDNYGGKPPSPRDIQDHFRKHGDIKEWIILWESVVRSAEKLKELEETPNLLRQALFEIMKVELPSSTVDAVSSGGTNQTK